MAFLLHILIIGLLSVCSVAGYNLVFGKGKVLHFGHVGISAISAYAIFLTLMATRSYALAATAGLVATCAASAVVALLALRLDDDSFGVMTIALHFMVLSFLRNLPDLTRGDRGIAGIPRMAWLQTNDRFLLALFLVTALWLAFLFVLLRTSFGRSLSALAEHPWYAGAIGISRMKATMLAFLLAGTGAFLSNLFFAQYLFLLLPGDFVFAALIFQVLAVVTGGPGRIFGVALATVSLTFLHEGLRFMSLPSHMVGPLRLILFGFVLYVAIWLRRKTLFPARRSI